MAIKAKLRFRGDMPWALEHKLITRYGFRVFARSKTEWLIVEKIKTNFKPEVLVNGELAEDIQATLIKRCNTIINHFAKPDEQEYVIRVRIANMAATLPPLQRKFVNEWVIRNIGEDEDDALPNL